MVNYNSMNHTGHSEFQDTQSIYILSLSLLSLLCPQPSPLHCPSSPRLAAAGTAGSRGFVLAALVERNATNHDHNEEDEQKNDDCDDYLVTHSTPVHLVLQSAGGLFKLEGSLV